MESSASGGGAAYTPLILVGKELKLGQFRQQEHLNGGGPGAGGGAGGGVQFY